MYVSRTVGLAFLVDHLAVNKPMKDINIFSSMDLSEMAGYDMCSTILSDRARVVS